MLVRYAGHVPLKTDCMMQHSLNRTRRRTGSQSATVADMERRVHDCSTVQPPSECFWSGAAATASFPFRPLPVVVPPPFTAYLVNHRPVTRGDRVGVGGRPPICRQKIRFRKCKKVSEHAIKLKFRFDSLSLYCQMKRKEGKGIHKLTKTTPSVGIDLKELGVRCRNV